MGFVNTKRMNTKITSIGYSCGMSRGMGDSDGALTRNVIQSLTPTTACAQSLMPC